jgi:hypothetical protein
MSQPIIVRFGRPVTMAELTGGVKGRDALKRGAERLGAILSALHHGDLYPALTDLEPENDRASG